MVSFENSARHLQVVYMVEKVTLASMMTMQFTGDQIPFTISQFSNSFGSISLALRFTLESSSIGNVPAHFLKVESPVAQNPYILPFAVRGLLEEDHVKLKLQSEVTELLHQFDEWKPSSKVLKDVKFRLEGVRSRL